MKGLLLKDWYMMKAYCRSFFFIAAGFIALSLTSPDNMFFTLYPCLLCGMIPITLLGYDERSRWTQYSGTMPYTKPQIVSAKYLIGLLAQLVVIAVTGMTHAAKMMIVRDFALGAFAVQMLLMLTVSPLTSAISLPFIFKLGVERGRMAYYGMLGFLCAASIVDSNVLSGHLVTEIKPSPIWLMLAAGAAIVYALSWRLSIVFFAGREIQ